MTTNYLKCGWRLKRIGFPGLFCCPVLNWLQSSESIFWGKSNSNCCFGCYFWRPVCWPLVYSSHQCSDKSLESVKRKVEKRQLEQCCHIRDIEVFSQLGTQPIQATPIKEESHTPPSLSESPSPTPAAKRLPMSIMAPDWTSSTSSPSENSEPGQTKSEDSTPLSTTSYTSWPPRRACTMVFSLNMGLISEEKSILYPSSSSIRKFLSDSSFSCHLRSSSINCDQLDWWWLLSSS